MPRTALPAVTSGVNDDDRCEIDALRRRLTALHLEHAAAALGEIVARSVSESWSPPVFLDHLLRAEADAREERRIRTSLRLSGLPGGITLADFDFAFQPAVERTRIETLATGAWIQDRRSLLLLGPPGVGKTHLAIGLGVAAVERGFSVSYTRIENLLHDLRRDAHLPPSQLRRRKYMNAALLIIDEMGFEPLTRDDANLFFRLVSYRYQRGSILITSNKNVRDWPEMLAGDETLAGAILDRLLHASHVLPIKGRSYRLRDLDDRIAAAEARSAAVANNGRAA
jgi:DNA replication protein DnaC